MELHITNIISITPKGRLFIQRFQIFPRNFMHSILESLSNKNQDLRALKTLGRGKSDLAIHNFKSKGYLTIIPVYKSYKATHIELVAELTELNTHGKYTQIIENAKNYLYHDYKSESDTPKDLLLQDLWPFKELESLSNRVAAGEFNEPWR